jgi:predicted RNase H-like nuclease (RuvC/YqgF family)
MNIQKIIKKHGIKIRGLAGELCKCDELNQAWKQVADYATTNQGLQSTVKALQAELDRQKLRANELFINLEEAKKQNQNHSAKAADDETRKQWLERKVTLLQNRVEQLEDHAVSNYYDNELYKKQ